MATIKAVVSLEGPIKDIEICEHLGMFVNLSTEPHQELPQSPLENELATRR